MTKDAYPKDLPWRDLLTAEIRESVRELREHGGGGELLGYALLTDLDARYLLATGYTATILERFPEPDDAFSPYEWPEAQHTMKEASARNASDVDAHYDAEADLDEEIGPDDDHLRPWKRERIATMAEVLASLRTELFPAEALVVVHCDDVGSTMGSWIIDAVRKLNSPERYAEWAAAYGID
ncbi:MAG: hypothetical protein CMN30_19260 [Sandaracinus sp.]|nr:hypothetical protein [Sandaracinus sp.]|tara:strand:+ start:1219 stop:1764 length:546 start_codon:yes stop_codon:yes gene_type:complete